MHCRCVSYLEAVWVLGLELCLRAPAVQESKANGWEGTAGQDVVCVGAELWWEEELQEG